MQLVPHISHQTHSQVVHLKEHCQAIQTHIPHQTHSLLHHLADREVLIPTGGIAPPIVQGGDVVIPLPEPLAPIVFQGRTSRVNVNNLPLYDFLDETNPVYFYFGWEDIHGHWLVERQVRDTSQREFAYGADNDGLDYDAALDDRETLNYG